MGFAMKGWVLLWMASSLVGAGMALAAPSTSKGVGTTNTTVRSVTTTTIKGKPAAAPAKPAGKAATSGAQKPPAGKSKPGVPAAAAGKTQPKAIGGASPAKTPPKPAKPKSTTAEAIGATAADEGPPDVTRLSLDQLRKTKQNYQEQVLKGRPDPYRTMMANPDTRSIAGPEGSGLVAMVKVRPSVGKGYNRQANQELANNPQLQEQLRARFAAEGGELRGEFVPPTKRDNGSLSNPYLVRPDGSRVELEWHHSPNHVGSVSLIPRQDHRLGEGGMDRLHYTDPATGQAKGGDALYTVPKPEVVMGE